MKLVLLPGLDGTGVLFRPFLKILPASIEPIVVSYPTREALGYDELLSLIRSGLPKDDPFVLLGESFGGPLSLRIAAEHPRNLRGLILAGSFVSCPFRFVPASAARFVTTFPFYSFAIYSNIFAAFRSEQGALSKEAITQVAAHVFAHRVREILKVNVTAELKACDVPILYLQGARDWTVTARNLQRIVAIKPSVHTAVIASSHMILKTQPRAALNAILRFVERLPENRDR